MDARKNQILHEKERAYWYWFAAQWTVLLTGALGSLIALSVQKENYTGWFKFAIVALPALSSLAATVLTTLRLHDLWRIRDEGRVKFTDVAQRGHIRLGACTSAQECQKAHEELEKEFSTIEKSMTEQWFAARRVPLRKDVGGL
jgi:hypothetical protein